MPKLFITIILLIGAAVAGLIYLAPAWQNFTGLRAEIQDLQNISAELDGLTQNRNALLDTVNTVSKDDLDRLNQALPQGQQASQLLVVLENMTSRRALALKRLDLSASLRTQAQTPGQPKPAAGTLVAPEGTINELPINISVSGSYESFRGFLADLENNVRLIDLQSLSFSSPEKSNLFDFTIQAKTYYQ